MVIAAAMRTMRPKFAALMLMQRRGRGDGSRGGVLVGGLSGGRSPRWPRQSRGHGTGLLLRARMLIRLIGIIIFCKEVMRISFYRR